MMNRRIGLKLLFLVIAAICSFQLLGLEEAFCDDVPFEASCHDCLVCPGHFIGALNETDSAVDVHEVIPSFTGYKFSNIQQPFTTFLRPPIAR